MKKLTLIVTENETGLETQVKNIGFNDIEIIGVIERSKIAILKNILDKKNEK